MNLNLGDTQLIISEAKARGALRNQLAYILATAYWETGRTMKPVKEAYWLSEDWRKRNLRYYPWYGRGYVQLTWEANYKKAAKEIGLIWKGSPDFALQSKNAAKILVQGMLGGWFTTKKLVDYVTFQKSDFVGARRIVNGTDKAEEIAKLAREYDEDLKKAGYGYEAKEPSLTLWDIIKRIFGL